MHSQRRKSARRRALLPARILLPTGVIECLVNDLSQEGAKLQFRTTHAGLPTAFKLWIGEEAAARTCRVCWTTGLHVGVSFEGGRNPLLNPAALQARLATLRSGQAVS